MDKSLENVKKLIQLFNGVIDEVETDKQGRIKQIVAVIGNKPLFFNNTTFGSIPFGKSKQKIVEMVQTFCRKMDLLLFYDYKSYIRYYGDEGYEFFKGECTDVIKKNDTFDNDEPLTISLLLSHMFIDRVNEIEFSYKAGKFDRSIKFQIVKSSCPIKVHNIVTSYSVSSSEKFINYITYGKTVEATVNALKEKFLLDEFRDEFVKNGLQQETQYMVIQLYKQYKSLEKQKLDEYIYEKFIKQAVDELNKKYHTERASHGK